MGTLRIYPIGSPPGLYEQDASLFLSLLEPKQFADLLRPRRPGAHKGQFGHLLVLAGSRGKTGAAAMAGLAALRAGAGLVTVASAESAIPAIAAHAAELMTEALPETDTGAISLRSLEYGKFAAIASGKDVLALGPGLGTHTETVDLIRQLAADLPQPMVLDADALNALAGTDPQFGGLRVLTPHPGEMARLAGISTAEVQANRVETARGFATSRQLILVLKGQRSLIAFPDGRVWVNPTGSPAMAKGGSGDILTGMSAAFLAQFPDQPDLAVAAAVYLHGRCGELAAQRLGDKCVLATELLDYLPAAMEECARLSDGH
jgi:NAD(P)H-hydrate epimerase